MTTLILSNRTDGGHTNRVQASGGGRRRSRQVCSHHSVHPGGALLQEHMTKTMRYGCLDGLSISYPHIQAFYLEVWQNSNNSKSGYLCAVVFHLLGTQL